MSDDETPCLWRGLALLSLALISIFLFPRVYADTVKPNFREHSKTQSVPSFQQNKAKEVLDTLNLEKALQLAAKNNAELQAYRLNAGIEDAAIVTASMRQNPLLFSDNGIAEYTYRLGVTQTFELGGKRKKRVAAAQAGKQKVLADINTRVLQLRGDTRQAYTNLFVAQEKEKAYQNILDESDRLLTIARQREQAGDISRMDVLGAKIASTNVKNDLQRSRYQRLEYWGQLSRLLYTPVNQNIVVEAPKQPGISSHYYPEKETLKATIVQSVPLDVEELVKLALTQRPELLSNHFQIEQNEASQAVAKANRVPNLSLSVGPDYVRSGQSNTVNVFAIGSVNLPVFDRQQGVLQQVAAQRKQLLLQKKSMENAIRFDVIIAHTAFIGSQERLKVYETELLPDALQVLEMSRLSFKEGKTSILMPLHAQQAYVSTRLGYLESLVNYQNAITNLEKAIGAGL